MSDDEFAGIEDFFRYISNMFSTKKESKRRINKPKSKGFRNENINIIRGRFTTDLIKSKQTGTKTGFNKKKNKFDTADRFNSLYRIDDP